MKEFKVSPFLPAYLKLCTRSYLPNVPAPDHLVISPIILLCLCVHPFSRSCHLPAQLAACNAVQAMAGMLQNVAETPVTKNTSNLLIQVFLFLLRCIQFATQLARWFAWLLGVQGTSAMMLMAHTTGCLLPDVWCC